jgi:hypothetical protein
LQYCSGTYVHKHTRHMPPCMHKSIQLVLQAYDPLSHYKSKNFPHPGAPQSVSCKTDHFPNSGAPPALAERILCTISKLGDQSKFVGVHVKVDTGCADLIGPVRSSGLIELSRFRQTFRWTCHHCKRVVMRGSIISSFEKSCYCC